MTDILSPLVNLQPPFNMIVLVVLITCATGVMTSGFKQFRKYLCHRQETELKRELVERGLTVDEIERIVRAQGTNTTQDT